MEKALGDITRYSKHVEESLKYWEDMYESLKKEIKFHNLSIKTLIQLTRNKKKDK